MAIKDIKNKKKSETESAPKVAMDIWISLKMAQEKRLRPEQRKELKVFLSKQGLTDIEDAEEYEKAFLKF